MQTSGPPNKPYRRKVARRNAPLQSHNWVFIHIPKTGGTSVRSALGMGARPYHVTAKDMWQKYPDWTSKFSFAFVRNPWDRLVSWVHRTSTWPPDRFDQLGLEPQVDYILDEDGKPLVDFIGRFESLADDFNTICGHLGIPTPNCATSIDPSIAITASATTRRRCSSSPTTTPRTSNGSVIASDDYWWILDLSERKRLLLIADFT